jgi:uncharacterized protein (DUF488 family)
VDPPRARLLTVGHGAVSAEEFLERCATARLDALVDIRTAPGSRRHPQFGRAAMAEWLPAAGITYAWERRLGGFRRPLPDSPNTALHNAAFRGYADYTRTDEFKSALTEVLSEARRRRLAVMCAETLWWRCHRRIVADVAVLIHGAEVLHILGGACEPHRLTDSARRDGGDVLYAGAPASPRPAPARRAAREVR